MSEYHRKVLKEASTFLARWSDVRAELWKLTKSHRTLFVVLGDEPWSGENLVLSLIEPRQIHAPISWRASQLTVESIVFDDGEVGFRILDRDSDVDVVSGGLAVGENINLSRPRFL